MKNPNFEVNDLITCFNELKKHNEEMERLLEKYSNSLKTNKEFYSVSEVVKYFGLTKSYIYKELRFKISTYKPGGIDGRKILFKRNDLLNFIESTKELEFDLSFFNNRGG